MEEGESKVCVKRKKPQDTQTDRYLVSQSEEIPVVDGTRDQVQCDRKIFQDFYSLGRGVG